MVVVVPGVVDQIENKVQDLLIGGGDLLDARAIGFASLEWTFGAVLTGLAFFRFGSTRILLERNAPLATLYFRVDDVAKAAEELRARGVAIGSGPSLIHVDDDGLFGPAGAEEWMAFFRDPDGNVLAIASQETSR